MVVTLVREISHKKQSHDRYAGRGDRNRARRRRKLEYAGCARGYVGSSMVCLDSRCRISRPVGGRFEIKIRWVGEYPIFILYGISQWDFHIQLTD